MTKVRERVSAQGDEYESWKKKTIDCFEVLLGEFRTLSDSRIIEMFAQAKEWPNKRSYQELEWWAQHERLERRAQRCGLVDAVEDHHQRVERVGLQQRVAHRAIVGKSRQEVHLEQSGAIVRVLQ